MTASKKSTSKSQDEPTPTASPPNDSKAEEALVLSYLRKNGLSEAASSLTKILRDREAKSNKRAKTSLFDDIDESEEKVTTGAGYDVDSVPAVALWGAGCPRLQEGGVRDEARGYIEGFTSLITWILSLGDDPAFVVGDDSVRTMNGTGKTLEGEKVGGGEQGEDDINTMEVDQEYQDKTHDETVADKVQEETTTHEPNQGLSTLVQNAIASASDNISNQLSPLTSNQKSIIPPNNLLTPPCIKPELLSLSFPLMVHTYCELLSCNMESTARAFLQTYRHIYEPSYPDAISDLDKCKSTALLVELNEAVMNQSAIQAEVRAIKAQMGNGSKKREEIQKSLDLEKDEKSANAKSLESNLSKIDASLSNLNSRLSTLSSKHAMFQSHLSTLPFLRRARALKMNITVSTSTYHALENYAASRSEAMVMTGLLMSRCHLIVERRDPVPYCPAVILDDFKETYDSEVKWAAPMHPAIRAMEAGENVQVVNGNASHQAQAKSILVHSESLPYPEYRVDKKDADAKLKATVEFNRALLVNGFRRLEALELKTEYESYGPGLSKESNNVSDPLAPSVLLGSLCCSCDTNVGADVRWAESHVGITSASICPPDGRKVAVGCDDAAVRIWSLDRHNKDASNDGNSSGSALGEPSMVLLGHKSGFPVFDVDWTRNGRTLLSAGGDGAIRLWDTDAVGPYGKLSNVALLKGRAKGDDNAPTRATLSAVDIPGLKPESMVEVSGAALSVYRGHAPSTPIWSVSSAPSGYYFASAGSDYTARIWCTERCSPLRVLTGHISPSVNCVTWHPNCNYVLTASDDKTCRMWDIQTGKCVRILSGSTRGLNLVRVSPSGKYAAGAGYDNTVRIWDLGNGRLVNELRPTESQDTSFSEGMINSMAYSACGSALAVAGEDCALRIWDVRGAASHLSDPHFFAATKGPNAVSSMSKQPGNGVLKSGARAPAGMFRTNNIFVLDLKYTKRNLLLSVGSYSA